MNIASLRLAASPAEASCIQQGARLAHTPLDPALARRLSRSFPYFVLALFPKLALRATCHAAHRSGSMLLGDGVGKAIYEPLCLFLTDTLCAESGYKTDPSPLPLF